MTSLQPIRTTRSSVAIVNAYVVPVTGAPVEHGTVLVEDGVITAVGRDVAVPPGVRTLDVGGRWVLPGLVEAHGHLGVHEEGEGWAGEDVNEMTDPNGAGLRAIDAVNIEDEGFRDALAGGVTSVVVKPGSGNPIGGQTVAIKTWGGRTVDEQVISDAVSVKAALGENPKRVYGDKKALPSTRLGVALVIRAAFVDAQNYIARRDAAVAKGEPFDRDLAKETLARVLTGELAWDQHTHRADDIAIQVVTSFMDKIRAQKTYRDSLHTQSVLTITSNVVYGKATGNTPDGRRRGEPFAPGSNPMNGRDTHGMLASALSVAKLPYSEAQDGISLTSTVVPSGLGRTKDEQVANLVGLLDGYNVSSGYHLNINVLNRETLEDAMEHPENYPQLTIRVSGYAVNFVRLTRDQQLDVLSRTFHGGL